MEFKFDAQQEYQINAIEAVTGLLEGQPRNEVDATFSLGGLAAVPNTLNLSEEMLLQICMPFRSSIKSHRMTL